MVRRIRHRDSARAQPIDRALAFHARAEPNGFERAQHAAGAVDVIHAPAPDTMRLRGLIASAGMRYRALNRRMRRRPAELCPRHSIDARGHVRGRGIDHRVVIGKRNLCQEDAVVVVVECAPAAVAILHAEQPGQAAARCLHASVLARNAPRAAAPSARTPCRPRPDRNRCEIQSPAAGRRVLDSSLASRPARESDFRAAIGPRFATTDARHHSGLFQRHHGDRRVPHRRNARLHPQWCPLLQSQIAEIQPISRAVSGSSGEWPSASMA